MELGKVHWVKIYLGTYNSCKDIPGFGVTFLTRLLLLRCYWSNLLYGLVDPYFFGVGGTGTLRFLGG